MKSGAFAVEEKEWLEVVDEFNLPFAVMTREAVHHFQLLHRSVFVVFYSAQGKLYLQQRQKDKEVHPGCWDISAAGHVLAGESRLEAAMRELNEELGVEPPKLYPVLELPGSVQTEYEFVSLFRTGLCRQTPQPDPSEVASGMFLECHEVDYLVKNYTHLLTPGLVFFWQRGVLFSGLDR